MRVGGWIAAAVAAALLAGAGTARLGWWSVPLAAALVTVLWRNTPRITLAVTLGAMLGWAVLLARDTAGGGMRMLGLQLAGVIGLPLPALVVATLAFAGLLAWGATALVVAITAR